MRALCTVPPVVPYKALENFSKALCGTTGGTYSARVFRPVMLLKILQDNYLIISFILFLSLYNWL